jgi:hypothetical protein
LEITLDKRTPDIAAAASHLVALAPMLAEHVRIVSVAATWLERQKEAASHVRPAGCDHEADDWAMLLILPEQLDGMRNSLREAADYLAAVIGMDPVRLAPETMPNPLLIATQACDIGGMISGIGQAEDDCDDCGCPPGMH